MRILRYGGMRERTRVSKLSKLSAARGIIAGNLISRKEETLSYSDTGHGLRIIEWSREGAKLMEKVVPFIRGSFRPANRGSEGGEHRR